MISIERPKHEPKMQNIAQPTFHQVQPTKKQKQEEQMDTQDQTRTDSMDKSSRHTQDMSWQRTLLHFNENFSNQIESTDQRGNALHKPGTELTKPIHRTNKLCSGGIRSLDIRSRSVTILGFHLNEPRWSRMNLTEFDTKLIALLWYFTPQLPHRDTLMVN